MADFSGAKKKYLTIFVAVGVTGTALLYLVQSGDWMKASIFYIIASIVSPAASSSTTPSSSYRQAG